MFARHAVTALRLSVLTGVTLFMVACATHPEVRSQTALRANLASYHTYGFMPKLGTDADGYKTLMTQSIERAVNREMLARGYTLAAPGQQPDLLINFSVKTHDKVQSEPGVGVGVGYGWGWGRYGAWGCCLGNYYNDIRTVTDGSLTVDVVDREHNEAVWSGTAVGRLTKKVLDNPDPTIDRSVADIFKHFPVGASAAH